MARLARGAVWWVAAAVVVSTLVGFLGSWTWVFDLVANFRPQLLVAAAVVAVVALVLAWRDHSAREFGVAVALVVCVAVNALTMVPLWTGGSEVPAANPRVTVGHLNLQGRRGDPAGFVDFLNQNSVDVFVVLDADPSWVAAARESAGAYRVVAGPAETSSWVFAKIPITDLTHPAEAGLPSAALQFTVSVGSSQVRVLALHTLSPISPGGARERDDALSAVAQWDRHQAPGPRVVTGDFNATRWSASLRQLLSDSPLGDSDRGFGYQPTFPARVWPLAIPIDQSLHSSQLITAGRSTGPTFGSGHNSLIVTYAVAEPAGSG